MLNISLNNKIYGFLIGIVLSAPLISDWLGNLFTYTIYLLAIIWSFIKFIKNNFFISRLEISFFLIIVLALVSSIYTISSNVLKELLFIPLIVSLYIGSKIIALNNLYKYMFTGMCFNFLLFTLYLIPQLVDNGFNYNLYYWYSYASNRVDYLTLSMYGGILFFYVLYNFKNNFIKYLCLIYILVIIYISGARFSMIFMTLFIIMFFFVKSRSIKFLLKSIIFLFLIIFFLKNTQSNNIIDIFNFALTRLNNLNLNNASIEGRIYAINKSLEAINNNPIVGYGLNSSPDIIHFIYPHNLLLEVWLDMGIIGLILLLIFIAISLFCFLKIIFNEKKSIYIAIIYIYILLNYFKSFSIFQSTLFFTFSGLLINTCLFSVKRKDNEN